jgi:uncharacterized membrane-anchored protein
MRNKIYLLFVFLIAGALVYGVCRQERTLKSGEIFYLRLAPLDPRSLMQGDYMQLNYSVDNKLPNQDDLRGKQAVLVKDAAGAASFSRIYEGEPLAANEIKVNIMRGNAGFSVAPESYMFQEGLAKSYEAAKYAVLKTDGSGKVLLVNLADESLNIIN